MTGLKSSFFRVSGIQNSLHLKYTTKTEIYLLFNHKKVPIILQFGNERR